MEAADRRGVVIENAAQAPVRDRRLGGLVGQLGDAVAGDRGGNGRAGEDRLSDLRP